MKGRYELELANPLTRINICLYSSSKLYYILVMIYCIRSHIISSILYKVQIEWLLKILDYSIARNCKLQIIPKENSSLILSFSHVI